MASRLGFRQHLLLLFFLDLFILMFAGLSTSSSFLVKFIQPGTGGLVLSTSSGIFLTILTMFVGISSIGVTSGSNFSGVTGTIASFLGVNKINAGSIVAAGTVAAVITDYIIIYQFILGGSTSIVVTVFGMIIFLPLIIDALFASLDWARGVNT